MTRTHPFDRLPDYRFWSKDPGIGRPERFDPVTQANFRIDPRDPVALAGGSFAARLGRQLGSRGLQLLVTERAHPILPPPVAANLHFGEFSARHGPIETPRQLKQLLQRAYDFFEPLEIAWATVGGRLVDPFRPRIQDGGYVSIDELLVDRATHFAAVREAVESMSVLVLSLEQIEAWVDRRDGAVFPLAPGLAGGVFDDERFAMRGFGLAEVVDDLQWSLEFIRARNPHVRTILLVSPVAPSETGIDRHVSVSASLGKAVLRLAAEEVCARHDACDYFPAYEVVTSPHVRGRYHAPDGREVTRQGIEHVASLLLRHYAGEDRSEALAAAATAGPLPLAPAATGAGPDGETAQITDYGLRLRHRQDREYTKVLITGLGRSGTSAVASLAKHLDYFMGAIAGTTTDEDKVLQEMLLADRIDDILAELQDRATTHPRVAWKSPKLFAKAGRRLIDRLPDDWALVLTSRDPVLVASRHTREHGTNLIDNIFAVLNRQASLMSMLREIPRRTIFVVAYERLIAAPHLAIQQLVADLGPTLLQGLDADFVETKMAQDHRRYRNKLADAA